MAKQPSRTPAKSYRDLEVWRKSHELVLLIYRATQQFPADERFGLTQQVRRAAVSVPANIAEGFGRRTKPDKRRFLHIAQGSLEETRYYCELGRDLGYLKSHRLDEAVEEVSRMINAAERSLQN